MNKFCFPSSKNAERPNWLLLGFFMEVGSVLGFTCVGMVLHKVENQAPIIGRGLIFSGLPFCSLAYGLLQSSCPRHLTSSLSGIKRDLLYLLQLQIFILKRAQPMRSERDYFRALLWPKLNCSSQLRNCSRSLYKQLRYLFSQIPHYVYYFLKPLQLSFPSLQTIFKGYHPCLCRSN